PYGHLGIPDRLENGVSAPFTQAVLIFIPLRDIELIKTFGRAIHFLQEFAVTGDVVNLLIQPGVPGGGRGKFPLVLNYFVQIGSGAVIDVAVGMLAAARE